MKKQDKRRKERRVLIAALFTAGVITAGSTFAWFTSKDEVTNRLSASASYNVSIAEDFQPTDDWIPGQTVNKDVSAVNTGNVDALVRMWLEGEMKLLSQEKDEMSVESGAPTLSDVDDPAKVKLGLTKYDNSGDDPVYYRTLKTDRIENPGDRPSTEPDDEDTNVPARFSEVQSVQAGGVLAYAPSGAKYHWTLEQAAELPVGDAAVMTNLAKDTVVGNSISDGAAVKLAPFSDSDTNYYGAIDASTFQPETEGLYIFRRAAGRNDNNEPVYEYSGYYFVPGNPAVYYALQTGEGAIGNSDYVLDKNVIHEAPPSTPSGAQVLPVTVDEDGIYFYTATEKLLKNDDLAWKYTAADSAKPAMLTASFENGTDDDTTDDIVIEIALANIGTDPEEWTEVGSEDKKATFYYNNDVEAGDTTSKLVDSVKLVGDNLTQDTYLAFDFDLNVFLESVQVIVDENGNENVPDAVKPWGETDNANTEASAAPENDGAEIRVIEWT